MLLPHFGVAEDWSGCLRHRRDRPSRGTLRVLWFRRQLRLWQRWATPAEPVRLSYLAQFFV